MDLLDLNRAAIDVNVRLTGKLEPAHFDLATPCAGWTVRDLLQHQVDMSLKFDAGARGGEARAQADDDLVVAYLVASDQVTESFQAAGFLDREAEFPGFGTHPGRNLVGAHFVDNLVHSWDLCRALGIDSTLDDELALAAYKMARHYPATPDVRGPGAAFGLPLDVPEDASLTDRLVGLLGRSPDWRA
ncbi:TIGR03086 family metal-binding protein [Actinosynnema sp. CS-041913]|uniref:TIGR03086 family metal-binding protein n=1 Tax=Actinosynnema sp. CS-041913 TaxID=3239917 RepID=UPI003D8D90EE